MDRQQLLALLYPDLERIEEAIAGNLSSHVPYISNVSRYILFSGGKRVRPLLMVLSARMCGYERQNEYSLSSVFEYLHAATLLHDDVVDNAEIRRGKDPAKNIYGNQAVILVGDFLYSKALLIAGLEGDIRIMEPLLEATTLMAEGEVLQLLNEENLEATEEEYMRVIHRKTAVLMSAACQVGAVLGKVSPEKEEAMRVYGEKLGIAFQLTDDLLDYTADTKEFGKKVGNDLTEGKVTLPLIHALQRSSEEHRGRIRDIFFRDNIEPENFAVVRDLIAKYNGFDYVLHKARYFVNTAKECLSVFPSSPTRDILLGLADYIITRRK